MVQCLETLARLFWNQKSIIDYYIPDRLEEGYGLSVGAIETLSEGGTKVIITVDCGVNSFEEARFAREKGIDLIITDHHEPGDKLLDGGKETAAQNSVSCGCDDAFGLINPKLTTSNYPFRELAGVGVAFMLAWALGQIASTRSNGSAGQEKADRAGTVRSPNKKVASEFKDFPMWRYW